MAESLVGSNMKGIVAYEALQTEGVDETYRESCKVGDRCIGREHEMMEPAIEVRSAR